MDGQIEEIKRDIGEALRYAFACREQLLQVGVREEDANCNATAAQESSAVETAQTLANSASTAAANAQTTANTALKESEAALGAAGQAKTTADSLCRHRKQRRHRTCGYKGNSR